jgi:hypothetical protein
MALSKDVRQREYNKFKEVGSQTTVAVSVYDSSGNQTNLAKETGGNLADIKTNTDNIPSSPSTETKQDSIITKLTTPTGINGAPVTVGNTAVEMTFTGTTKVIAIKAASTNTGLIWFGPSTVDSTGTNAYGELTADSSVEIELNDASSAIYCVASIAAQKVYKAALT